MKSGEFDRRAHRIAVVSDASDFRREPGSTVLTELLCSAALLRERAGITATALSVTAADEHELTADLRRIAPDFSSAYLTLTDPVRAEAAQAALAGTLTVITERQSRAIALTAALLSMLDHRGIQPAASSVVIVGAEQNPLLAALIVAARVGEVSRWSLADAHNFPLRALERRGAIVINLLSPTTRAGMVGAANSTTWAFADDLRADHTEGVTDDATLPLLAIPLLLRLVRRDGFPLDIAACLACALALARRTPPGKVLPPLSAATPEPVASDPDIRP